jgi:hypothetical protein
VIKTHPHPATKSGWWASCGDEDLAEGPYTSKSEAIAGALREGAYKLIFPDDQNPEYRAAIYVGLYRDNHVRLDHFFHVDQWLEMLVEADDGEHADEDGERNPLEEISSDDKVALENAVRDAIWNWQHTRAIPLKTWNMEIIGEGETVITTTL